MKADRIIKSAASVLGAVTLAASLAVAEPAGAANTPVSFSEIGQRATADYHGDALAVTTTPRGALLRCGFQKLQGRATSEGLWLESTAAGGGMLRLVAKRVGRQEGGQAFSRARSSPIIGKESGLAGTLALPLPGPADPSGLKFAHTFFSRNAHVRMETEFVHS